MHLVQLLLPQKDNEGKPFPRADFDRVRSELTGRFGGVTAFLQSPASGLWKDDGGDVASDEMLIFEVMVEALDRSWWTSYRRELEARFRQDEVVARALAMERL